MNKGQKRPLTLAAGIIGVCAASVSIILWMVFYGIGLSATLQLSLVSIIIDANCLVFAIRLLVIRTRSAKEYVKNGNWGVAFLVVACIKLIWVVFGMGLSLPIRLILILLDLLYVLCAIFAMVDFKKAKEDAAKVDVGKVNAFLNEFKKEKQNICPYCGTDVEVGQKECPNCGAHTKRK